MYFISLSLATFGKYTVTLTWKSEGKNIGGIKEQWPEIHGRGESVTNVLDILLCRLLLLYLEFFPE